MMKTLEEQYTLLKFWADGTDFVLDAHKSPKAEFARLAQMKRWVGGDANWRTHWQVCFGEAYRYGAGRTSSTTATLVVDSAAPGLNLVDRMRRLSVGSDTSEAFSIISSAPSVYSLESADGGVRVNHEPEIPEAPLSVDSTTLTIRTRPAQPTVNIVAPVPQEAEAEATPTPAPGSAPTATCSPFWFQFPGFTPNPTVTFMNEFSRLASHQTWDQETRKQQKVAALISEVNFYYGTCMDRLESWKSLCAEVGIEPIPTSITQCKKALKAVYVNLYNIIDHRRNPAFNVMVFKSYGEFTKYTRKGRTFPRESAKQGGFIKVLLRKI